MPDVRIKYLRFAGAVQRRSKARSRLFGGERVFQTPSFPSCRGVPLHLSTKSIDVRLRVVKYKHKISTV